MPVGWLTSGISWELKLKLKQELTDRKGQEHEWRGQGDQKAKQYNNEK